MPNLNTLTNAEILANLALPYISVCLCCINTVERSGHSGTDGSAPGGSGRSSADMSAAAELRRRSSHRLTAGLHRRTDGQRGRSANPQR